MRAFFLDLGGNCSASSAVKVFDMKILFKGEGKKKIPLTGKRTAGQSHTFYVKILLTGSHNASDMNTLLVCLIASPVASTTAVPDPSGVHTANKTYK